jgi:arylsulfatase A-like enzyme
MHTSRPNIVLITPHDLGTHIGCYGWDPALKTPTLDALAAQGTRFTNHFCTATFCSPSRGGIMTGKYPHVNGLMGLVNLGWDLPDGCDTLPDLLHADGYETVLFGFQHIVDDPARLPYDRIGPRGQYSCRQVAENVAAFLAERSAEEREAPLYLELGFSEVHRPYGRLERIDAPESEVVPLPFLDDTPGVRMDLAMFYENIRRLDDAVGSILQSLERAGMAENTVVVFTTDHGIAFPRAKSTLYDPGIRTTLLVRWPGVTDPGSRRHRCAGGPQRPVAAVLAQGRNRRTPRRHLRGKEHPARRHQTMRAHRPLQIHPQRLRRSSTGAPHRHRGHCRRPGPGTGIVRAPASRRIV